MTNVNDDNCYAYFVLNGINYRAVVRSFRDRRGERPYVEARSSSGWLRTHSARVVEAGRAAVARKCVPAILQGQAS